MSKLQQIQMMKSSFHFPTQTLYYFQVSSKSGKTFSIFLSSEYERSQWVEALKILQVLMLLHHE